MTQPTKEIERLIERLKEENKRLSEENEQLKEKLAKAAEGIDAILDKIEQRKICH